MKSKYDENSGEALFFLIFIVVLIIVIAFYMASSGQDGM
jgi:preprotein translocase subunit YajC